MKNNRLTGTFFFKKTLLGLVLMVGYYKVVCDFPGDDSPDIILYRKATQEDLCDPKLNRLT